MKLLIGTLAIIFCLTACGSPKFVRHNADGTLSSSAESSENNSQSESSAADVSYVSLSPKIDASGDILTLTEIRGSKATIYAMNLEENKYVKKEAVVTSEGNTLALHFDAVCTYAEPGSKDTEEMVTTFTTSETSISLTDESGTSTHLKVGGEQLEKIKTIRSLMDEDRTCAADKSIDDEYTATEIADKLKVILE